MEFLNALVWAILAYSVIYLGLVLLKVHQTSEWKIDYPKLGKILVRTSIAITVSALWLIFG